MTMTTKSEEEARTQKRGRTEMSQKWRISSKITAKKGSKYRQRQAAIRTRTIRYWKLWAAIKIMMTLRNKTKLSHLKTRGDMSELSAIGNQEKCKRSRKNSWIA